MYLSSVPYHFMQYELPDELDMVVVVLPVCLSYKWLMEIVSFFSFAILLTVVSCLQV